VRQMLDAAKQQEEERESWLITSINRKQRPADEHLLESAVSEKMSARANIYPVSEREAGMLLQDEELERNELPRACDQLFGLKEVPAQGNLRQGLWEIYFEYVDAKERYNR